MSVPVAALVCLLLCETATATNATEEHVHAGIPHSLEPENGDYTPADPTSPPELTEVVVVARRPPPAGSTINTIRTDDPTSLSARSVAELLEPSPWIDINRGPKSGASLLLRGFDGKSTQVLYEGIPFRTLYDNHVDLSMLPSSMLGSIDIERGVTSILYGPGSMGGVVSLRAPSPSRCMRDKGSTELSIQGGQFYDNSLLDTSGTAGTCMPFSDGRGALFLSGGLAHSKGYILSKDYQPTPENARYHEDGGLRDGSDFSRASATLLLTYRPTLNSRTSLFLNGSHAQRGIPTFEGSNHVRYWRFPFYQRLVAGISGQWAPFPSSATTTGIQEASGYLYTSLHRDEIRDYSDLTYSQPTSSPLAWFTASAYSDAGTGAGLAGSWAPTSSNTLYGTARLTHDLHRSRDMPVVTDADRAAGRGDPEWTPWNRYSSYTLSIAMEDIQTIGRWRVGAGLGGAFMGLLEQQLRHIDLPVSNRMIVAPEGRLFTDVALTRSFRMVAAAGHKVRFPNLKELFTNHMAGNPDLKLERAWMAETGLDTSHDLGTRGGSPIRLHTTSRLFSSLIRDSIERWRDSYANLKEAQIHGGELGLRIQPLPQLELTGGYRYLYTAYTDSGRPMDYRAPHRGTLGLSLGAPDHSPLKGFTMWGQLLANSSQSAEYYDGSEWIQDRIAGHILVNAQLRYHQQTHRGAATWLALTARNLLDVNYARGSYEPRAGRELFFGVGVQL